MPETAAVVIGGHSESDPQQIRRLSVVEKVRIRSEMTKLDDQLFPNRDPGRIFCQE